MWLRIKNQIINLESMEVATLSDDPSQTLWITFHNEDVKFEGETAMAIWHLLKTLGPQVVVRE